MLDKLQIEDFSGRIGEKFRLQLDAGGEVGAELVEASGVGGNQLNRAPFSLVFRAPAGAVEEQRLYRLVHEEMGTLDLFLVPIGPDAEGMRCEAVFT